MAGDSKMEELERIALVVHALVVSRKPPARLVEILRDYKEMECEYLPYDKLGYRNAEDLLQSTGKFDLTKSGNDVNIDLTAHYFPPFSIIPNDDEFPYRH